MGSRVVVVIGSLVVGISAIALDACSSDDVANAGAGDASGDNAARDVVLVVEDAEANCDPDADLLARVEDASILDGASTTGICSSCMSERCAYELARCAEDCPCQGIVGDALQCYLTTQELACLGRLTNYLVRHDTRARALQLSGCARSSCAMECAVDGGAVPEASVDSSTD